MKAAVAQIKLYNDRDANVTTISHFISLASNENIDIICFPECAITGYVRDFTTIGHNSVLEALDTIHEVVRRNCVSAIVGAPYGERGNRFNSAIVLLANGARYIYHKINLTSFEDVYFKNGKEPLTVQLDTITFGILICRDQNDPMLAHEYKKLGADALFILSAHYYKPIEAVQKLDKNRALPIARAVENNLFVLKANAVGVQSGKISLGGSLVIDPMGRIIHEGNSTDEMIFSFQIEEREEQRGHSIIFHNQNL
jgi:predicted amidohydrolase